MEYIVIHSKSRDQDCRSNCLLASTRPQHAIGRLSDPPNPPHVTTLFGTPPWHPNRQPGSCIPTFPFFSRRPSARARRALAAVIRPHAAGGPSGPSLEPPMVSSCSEPPRPRPRPIWRRCSFSSEICSALAGQWRGRPAPGLALPGRDWPGPGGGWTLDVGCCTYGRVCLSMPIPGSRAIASLLAATRRQSCHGTARGRAMTQRRGGQAVAGGDRWCVVGGPPWARIIKRRATLRGRSPRAARGSKSGPWPPWMASCDRSRSALLQSGLCLFSLAVCCLCFKFLGELAPSSWIPSAAVYCFLVFVVVDVVNTLPQLSFFLCCCYPPRPPRFSRLIPRR